MLKCYNKWVLNGIIHRRSIETYTQINYVLPQNHIQLLHCTRLQVMVELKNVIIVSVNYIIYHRGGFYTGVRVQGFEIFFLLVFLQKFGIFVLELQKKIKKYNFLCYF